MAFIVFTGVPFYSTEIQPQNLIILSTNDIRNLSAAFDCCAIDAHL